MQKTWHCAVGWGQRIYELDLPTPPEEMELQKELVQACFGVGGIKSFAVHLLKDGAWEQILPEHGEATLVIQACDEDEDEVVGFADQVLEEARRGNAEAAAFVTQEAQTWEDDERTLFAMRLRGKTAIALIQDLHRDRSTIDRGWRRVRVKLGRAVLSKLSVEQIRGWEERTEAAQRAVRNLLATIQDI